MLTIYKPLLTARDDELGMGNNKLNVGDKHQH